MQGSHEAWDVDFTLSLHNRTGKYFIGRDLIDGLGREYFRSVKTWRAPAALAIGSVPRQVLGKLWWEEYKLRERALPSLPLQQSPRRVLHLDPMTVLNWRVSERDAVLCHDIGPITHPELFNPEVVALYRKAYARIAATMPRMIFVSRASRDAFARLYGFQSAATVIYPPVRGGAAAGEETAVDGVGERFFLTVGSIGRRKNQTATIAAFARSGLAQAGFRYVLCGSREPGAEAVLEQAERTAGVTVLPYVSDLQLRWLYRRAHAFVLVSLLEGFGIPVVEALQHGLMPLVSRDSVLEEVAGPLALVADPTSVDEIAEQMRALATRTKHLPEEQRGELQARLSMFGKAAFLDGWRQVLTGSR